MTRQRLIKLFFSGYIEVDPATIPDTPGIYRDLVVEAIRPGIDASVSTEEVIEDLNLDINSNPPEQIGVERLQLRLDNARSEIHTHWGAVPYFCAECDALVEGDMEECPACGLSFFDDEDDWDADCLVGYDANGSPV